MARRTRGPRSNTTLILATTLLAAVAGVVEITRAHAPTSPPNPKADVIGELPTAHTAKLAPMKYSVPTHIDIPAVNVHADIIEVNINPDESLGTPPLSNAKVAGWYEGSVTPGQTGASIIDAHVDSRLMKDHRGAFFYLGLAKPGMEVDVTRADHSVSVFTIDEVQEALKTQFPTDNVYSDTAYPSLRLITCGGDFDRKTHEYQSNTIVYAHLTADRQHTGRAIQ